MYMSSFTVHLVPINSYSGVSFLALDHLKNKKIKIDYSLCSHKPTKEVLLNFFDQHCPLHQLFCPVQYFILFLYLPSTLIYFNRWTISWPLTSILLSFLSSISCPISFMATIKSW